MSAKDKIPVFGKIEKGVTYHDRPGAYGFLPAADGRIAIIETSYGFFLPGGGKEAGEDHELALKREIFEEIGWTVTAARLVGEAEQFHWSEFYQKYFRKIGRFYHVEATAEPDAKMQAEHKLLWWTVDQAAKKLSQEFQRWGVKAGYELG